MTGQPSLFTRLGRFRSRGREQTEDRLTELTAALIEHDPGFAALFRAALLPEEKGATIKSPVATQRYLWSNGAARRVDLELRLDNPRSATGLLVWVEVKLGADEHGGQFGAYRELMPKFSGGATSRLRLLVPSARVDRFSRFCASEVVTWDTIASGLEQGCTVGDASPTTTWLVGHYVSFLRDCGAIAPLAPTPEERETYRRMRDIAEQVYSDFTRSDASMRDAASSSSFSAPAPLDDDNPPQLWCQHTCPTAGVDANSWCLEWGITTEKELSNGSPADLVVYAGWVRFGGWGDFDPTEWRARFETALETSATIKPTRVMWAQKGAKQATSGAPNDFLIAVWPASGFVSKDAAHDAQQLAKAIRTTFAACARVPPSPM